MVRPIARGARTARSLTALLLALRALLAAEDVAADVPTSVVSGGVATMADGLPSLFDVGILWYTFASCDDPGSAALIQRGSVRLPPPRVVFSFLPPLLPGACNPYALASNIESDADAIYYVDNQGPGGVFALWRRLRLANPGDASTLLTTFPGVPLDFYAEIQRWNDVLFVIAHEAVDVMREYHKLTGALVNPQVAPPTTRWALGEMQVNTRFLFWLNGGALWRDDLTNGAQIVAHAGPVTAYEVGYFDESCDPGGQCSFSSPVVVAVGRSFGVLETLPTPQPLVFAYTSPDPSAVITSILRDAQGWWFFETRNKPGQIFAREDWLFFKAIVAGPPPALKFGPVDHVLGYDSLRTDETHVYFRDRSDLALWRLPNDAASIPVHSLTATGIEVTQGSQTLNHSVSLVRGRRTFVRLYHRSNGAIPVPSVSAALEVRDANFVLLGRLVPVNRIGPFQVSLSTPSNRLALDSAFLFELPYAWTQQSQLSFAGTINPNRALLESNLLDNTAAVTLPLVASPRLPLEIVTFEFNYAGQYRARKAADDLSSLSWMRRLYPLDQVGGSFFQPGPGIRYTTRIVSDDGIVAHLDQVDPGCNAKYFDPVTMVDNRNMCATDYAIARLHAMQLAGEIATDRFLYAAIAQGPGVPVPRGFTRMPDRRISGGGSARQDTLAHETGHMLGRDHPGTGADPVCTGQISYNDPQYPHPLARIGASTTAAGDPTALLGLDPGDYTISARRLLPSSTTGDFMSYCFPWWISDYTHDGLLARMNAAPPSAPGSVGAPVTGDWLIAVGGVSPTSATGAFDELRRTDAVAEVPTLVPGRFRLELRGTAGALLGSHSFTPEEAPHAVGGALLFALVVPFEPGTSEVRVVESATGRSFVSRGVSAHAPVVANVALVSPPDPVTGTVSLGWDASDTDGDVLRFDVLRTTDGGLSFRPLALSLTGTSVDLDTARWGGGASALRVRATDGVLTGVADGAPFDVAAKPPVVNVLSPADGLRVGWGTLVTFSADVADPQEAPVQDADIHWSNAYRTLGSGPVVSTTDLEVGTNVVTVDVTNGAGMSSQASVTVVVTDDLDLPGPKISVTPTSVPLAVSATETAAQSASLSIENVGGGALSVEVSSDAAWLLIEGGPGGSFGAPTTLALEVDPTALPDGTVSAAALTLRNQGDPSEVVTVPVTVAKGEVFTQSPFADEDGDGIRNERDNCARAANADQADSGGLGAGSPPDGIGDACQCGDVNGDGRVSLSDAVVVQRSLLQPPTAVATRPDLCDVGASPGCTLADAVLIRRALLSPATAFVTRACVAIPTP